MKLNELSASERLDIAIRARYPVVWIVSSEETRVQESVVALLESSSFHQSKTIFTWTVSRGVRLLSAPEEEYGSRDPVEALEMVATYGVNEESPKGDAAVFIFKDLHPYLQSPDVVRALRDVICDITGSARTLIVISPVLAVPNECARQVAVIEWPLPSLEELVELLDLFIDRLPPKVPVELNGERESVAKALQGLTEFQAQSVLATAVVATSKLAAEALEFIIAEKERVISESGLLEFFSPDDSLVQIGGLDLLKGYLMQRRSSFTEKARAYGIKAPKGVLLVGVPGCGKSLACKTLASMWQLPLIRLDVGALMGSLVGQSESNLRQALKVAESAAPAVVWLDEVEKGLSGVKSSGMSDGGTTARVFGTLLTWMQEHQAPVYLIATSNDISALPPEFLRAGRFDDIFFVDLPNVAERNEIWTVHLNHVGRDVEDFDIEALVSASQGYTGAEIEASVQAGLYNGFSQGWELRTADLVQAVSDRVPLTETMQEQITELRQWAKRRAKPASSAAIISTASTYNKAGELEI